MLVKIHKTEKRKIVSLCDNDLIGKKFEDDDLQLDVSGYFYKGTEMTEKDILKEVKDANSLNVVGKESIEFALKHKLISKENIIKIKNIPHAMSLL